MPRIIEAEEILLNYLEKLSRNCSDGYTVGVIAGQPNQTRDYVVHLAKSASTIKTKHLFSEISDSFVANHAMYVTRMLPGGMYILGIFVISPDDVFEDSGSMNKIKSILHNIHKVMVNNKFLYGTPAGHSGMEKLVLHYSTKTLKHTCKSIEMKQNNKPGMVKPVEWRFVSQSQGPVWQQLNCCYELDDIFPLQLQDEDISVKRQYDSVITFAANVIWSAIVFIDGELKDSSETLESIVKKKKTNAKQSNTEKQENKVLTVSMFVPSDFEDNTDSEAQTLRFAGVVTFSGVVFSSVWLHSKSSLAEAHQAIKCDIIRSLQSRIQICCDSLETDAITDSVFLSEPPRRVLIPLNNKICLSDYIFNGEGAGEAVITAKDILDFNTVLEKINCDIENPADTSEYQVINREQSEDSMSTKEETRTVIVVTGVVVAALVLLLSLFIKFYSSIFDTKSE